MQLCDTKKVRENKMAYSRTPKTVARVKPLLDEMVKSDKSIEWIFDEPLKVAYKIWEGIRFSIRSQKKEFEQYATLLNKYKIRTIEPNIVKAEIREESVLVPNGLIVRGVVDVLGAIGAAIEFKRDVLVFMDLKLNSLDDDDIGVLEIWCSNNSYEINKKSDNLELVRV